MTATAESFESHLATLSGVVERAQADTGHDALVVGSGHPFTYFADDRQPHHEVVPHFAWWCPLGGPHHLLVLRPGHRPRLIRHAPEDYWYEQGPLGDVFWRDSFDVEDAADLAAVWDRLGSLSRAAYVGDEPGRAEAAGLAVNPAGLVARLDWGRSYKTDYEEACLAEATARAARGHVAARDAFAAGASELAIHHAYLMATGATESDLPYTTIVGLDDKAAILHYENKRASEGGRVLLIDAGASCNGYGSDITRTHVTPSCDSRFVALRDGMERVQRDLCAAVKPGPSFVELHEQAHRGIASLLVDQGLVRMSVDAAVESGVSRAFFPHGLGHHLGIQVHDVAGHQADAVGAPAPPPEDHPFLRNTRTLEPRQVFTIEPGLYFIEMLLGPLRQGSLSTSLDWETIDALSPLGGIRIEDDVVVTETGHRNLTRECLP